MKLWLGNLAPDTTDDQLREFLGKYTKIEFTQIVRVPGDGSRPAATLEFAGGDFTAVYQVEARLNGMFWNNRVLVAHVMRD